MARPVIAVLNLDKSTTQFIREKLSKDYRVVSFDNNMEVKEFIKRRASLAIINPTFPGTDDLLFLRKIRELSCKFPIICIDKLTTIERHEKIKPIGSWTGLLFLPLKENELVQQVKKALLLPYTSIGNFLPRLVIKNFISGGLLQNYCRPRLKKLDEIYIEFLRPPKAFKPDNLAVSENPSPAKSDPELADLQVKFLGTIKVFWGKQSVCIRSLNKKEKLLFTYLLLNKGRKIHKDSLMIKFWEDASPKNAKASLNNAISKIRKVFKKLEVDIISRHGDTYSINQSLTIQLDVDEFRRKWREAKAHDGSGLSIQSEKAFKEVVEIYENHFLEEFPYEDWVEEIRSNLRKIYEECLERLVELKYYQEDYEAVILLGNQLLKSEPCLEKIHRKIMKAYAKSDHPVKAIRQYQCCSKAMNEHFNAEPSQETILLKEEIQDGRFR